MYIFCINGLTCHTLNNQRHYSCVAKYYNKHKYSSEILHHEAGDAMLQVFNVYRNHLTKTECNLGGKISLDLSANTPIYVQIGDVFIFKSSQCVKLLIKSSFKSSTFVCLQFFSLGRD